MENKDTTPKVIIPQTIEPGKITPITKLSSSKQGDYAPRVFVGGTDFGESKYDIDEATSSEFIKSGDYQYTRAEAQDNWDKAGNAVVRFAGRAATSAAELVGNVYGLGKYAIDLQTDPANRMEYFRKHGTLEGYKEATWTSIFDNEVTRGLDEADAWIKSKVPQYESKEYQNAPWYKKWQYANFYANDLADAAGFAVGSMVGGAAATKLTSNLFKIAKAGQLKLIDNITDGLKSGAINELQAAKEIDKIALKIKAVDYTDELTQMMFSGASESGQEARSTKDATFKKIIDDITVNPLTGKKYREATESEIRYAEMIAEDASEASFLLNMAVVGPTSKLMMDSVFKGYKGLKNTVDDVDGKFNVSAKYDPKTQVYTPEVQNRYLRTVKSIGKVLGNNTTEALQEMYQTGLQAGVEDFYAAKYHGKSDYDQLLKSTNVGLEKAVSDEGLSSALLGFLTPGVSNTLLRGATGQNPLGNFSNFNKDTKKNVLYTALLNKNKASDTFKTLYESASRHQHFQNQLDNAIENADDFAAKNQMHNIIENLVYSRVQTGRLQDLYKDMEYFKSLSNDEFKEVFGVELNEEDRKTTLDFVQNKINKVNDLVKTLESVKSVFRNVSPANQARIWHATNAAKNSNERSYKLSKEVSNIVMDNYKHLNESDYRTHLSLLGLDYKSLDETGKSNFRTLVANSEISLVDQKEIIKKLDDIDRLYKRSSNYRKLLLELNNDTVLDSLDKTDSTIGNEQDSDLTGKQSYEEHLSKKNQLLSEIEQSNDHEEILKLSKELDKNPLLEASDIESIKTKYDSIKKVSARRKQLTNKIIAAKNKRDNILSEIFKSNYEINDKSNEVNEIVSDYESGNSELSRDKLFKLIDKTQSDIFKLQDYIESLESQLNELDTEIDSLETLKSSNDTIESTIADRSSKAKELDYLNNEISTTKDNISRLQKILNKLRKIFRSLFPNHAYLLEKGKHEVVEYNEELLDKAQAIKELKATLKELEEERSYVQSQINRLDAEIDEYQRLLNSIPELKFEGVDTTTDDVETVQDPKAFEFQPAKKDIIYALNSTAGNNMIGDTDTLTQDPDQLRWFKYTDSLQVSSSSDIKLVAVTKTSNIFGEDIKFFDDNDIVLVVHENGKPVKVDGKLVFTSMRLPITLEEAKEKFTNKQGLTDVQIQTLIDDLTDTRELIKNSKEPMYLKVTSKTKGVPVYSKVTDANGKIIFRFPVKGRLTKNSKNIDDINMFVATEEETVIGTQVYSTVPGMAYFIYDQQVIPARVAKLGEIDGAVDKAVELISELMDIAKPEYKGKRLYKDVKDELNLLITFGNVFGKDSNNPRQIFVTKDGRLNYGGKYYDVIDEVSLKSFLADKYIRVDKKLINTNPKIKSPLNGKTVSYKNYLLNNDGKADNQVLVGTQLVEVGTQQFKNVGLRFDFSAGPREFVKKENKITKAVVKLDKDNKVKNDTAEETKKEKIRKLFDTEEETPNAVEDTTEEEIEEEEKEPVKEAPKLSKSDPNEIKERENILNELNNYSATSDIFDWDRTFTGEEIASLEDLDAEQEWFSNKFPNIPYERVKGLIQGKSVGRFLSSGKVLISDLAAKGTTYHEAFHVVSQMFLTDAELKSLYKEYRDRTGFEGTDAAVEELLAEDFRNYMLGERTSFQPKQKTIFQKIVDFLRNLLGIPKKDLDSIFSTIKSNKFKKPVRRAVEDFNRVTLDGKNVEFTQDLMDSMTVFFFKHMLNMDDSYSIESIFNMEDQNNYKDIYDKILNSFKANFANLPDSLKSKLEDNYVEIIKDWSKIVNKHIKYLEKYGIDISLDNELIAENEKIGKDNTQYIDSITFSTKDGMPKAVKLLIASLPQLKMVDGKRRPVLNYTFGLPKAVNFNKTIDFIHNTLAGSQSLEEMVKRLTDKSIERPELKTLLTYLKTNISEVTPTTLSRDQFNLQMKFFQQFAKTKNTYLTTMVDDEGNIYSFDSNSSKLGDRIKTSWRNSAKKLGNESNGFYKLVDGNVVLNKSRIQNIVNEYPLSNINNTISFLSKLGIEFSTDKFTEVEQGLLKEAALKIVKYVVDKDIKSIFQKDAVGETIKNLINIEANYTKEHVELQHINPEGKTVYGITLNTYLSLTVDSIKNTGKLEYLNVDKNPYVKSSLWRKLIAEGKKITLEVLEGLASTDKDADGVITSDLDMSSNLLQSINAILNNKFPFLRAGDKKLEYAFSIDFEMNRELFIEQMLQYYKDDISRSIALKEGKGANIQFYNNQASRSLIFEEITPIYPTITNTFKSDKQIDNFVEKNREAIVKDINNWLDKEIQNNFLAVLNDYGLISRSESKGRYDIEGIDKSTLSKIIGKENELTYDEIVRLGELFLTKSFIANVEQTKLFTGDLAFYDIAKGDFNKRTGGLTGPKKVCNTDPATNNWLKENAKRSDGKEPNGKINSIVYEDVKSTSEYYKEYAKFIGDKKAEEAYKNMKEADAQGYVTLDEYREFFLRSGEWTAKHEAAYTKAIKGEKLSKDDFQFFMPIKPQYFGPQTNDTLYVPTYYKLSLMPLIPSMIKDRKLAQLAESMKKNKVGIAMFASANKVGANLVEGGLSPFYDNVGNINDNTNIQEIDYKYLGIQLDIAPIEKTEVKFGTQFRKLILSNLFSGGKGKDITVFDGDKLVKKNTVDIKKEYDLIINELTKERRKALENKLGLKIENGKYTISDYNVFKDIILDEAESRDSVDNLLSSIELAFNGDIKAVDITMHKNKIEQILYAMVNNKVISQKVFGDMKVMGSSTGFEVKARKFKDLSTKDKSKIEWISNVDTLNFYHPTESNGTSKMQVLLPSWFKEVVGENLQSYDKRLLELIGYRIPTQGLNSIDSIEVVGFLPKEAGNLIITPSEIVGKAGSDYDVDKLNIFIPRYIMHSGKPHYLPTSTQALKKLFETIAPKNLTFEEWRNNNKQAILENRIIELSKEILSSPELFDQLINPNSVSTLTGLVSKIRDLKGTSKTKITGTKILKWYNNAQTALQFWSGKAGVGVSAIHNTSHILSQQAGLYMSAENMSIKLPCNITDNGDIDLSQEFSKDGKTRISDIINEFINAYVDIAKDPFIFELNAGIQTSGTWFFLLRAGVPVETIAMFMRQPIIWDYIKQQSINESMLNKSLGRELNAKKFEAKIRGMYPGKVSENYEFDSSLKKLESQLTGKIDNVYQQAILTEFLKYQQGGVMLSDLMRATNADTKGAGKNRLTARYQSEMLSDLKSQGVFGNLDTYINETVLSEFIKTVDDSSKYFNDIFVTDNQFVRDTLSEIEATFKAKNYTFDTLADLMLLAENEIINYIIQTTPLNDVKLSDEIDKLFKGDNSIAKQLSSAKNNAVLKTNSLVQELFPLLANNRKNIDNIKLFNKRLNNYESNVLTEAYEQLYNMAPDLADNLTKLCILQSGLNNSPISFLSIIPANKYFEIASKTIDVRLNGENVDLSDFIDLFYQNNYQNSKIVKKISNRVLFGKYAKGSLNNKGELVIPESMSENNPFVKVVTKDKLSKAEEAEKLANGDSIYTTRLFKLVAPGKYKEVPVKGNGMYLKDYRKTDNNVVNNNKENKVFAANRGNSKFDWEDASGLTFTSNENKTPINLPKSNKSGKLSVKDLFIVEDLFDTYEDKIRNKIQTRGEKFDPAKSLATMKEYAVQHGINELKEYLKNCYN